MKKNTACQSSVFNARTLLAFSLWSASALLFTLPLVRHQPPLSKASNASVNSRISDFNKLPLSFEPNEGQTDPAARFLAHSGRGTLYFTPSEIVLVLSGARRTSKDQLEAVPSKVAFTENRDLATSFQVLRLQFVGTSPASTITAEGEMLLGKVNYFVGSDPHLWRTNLPTRSRIVYNGLYPGVELSYAGTGGELKGTYTVAAGAITSRIRWRYEGATRVSVDQAGDLHINLANVPSELVEHAPAAWQEIGGRHVTVGAHYALAEDASVGFVLDKYDRSRPLIIDPVLSYSTYLGGNGYDAGVGLAVDSSGNAYITGTTASLNFPVTPGVLQDSLKGSQNAVVVKVNPEGSALIYSTYLGGSGQDTGAAIAVDASGATYLTGQTTSTDFPTTPGAFQTAFGAKSCPSPFVTCYDAFVTKVSPDGSGLAYSSYLGGSAIDIGAGIAVDAVGRAFVAGSTNSTNFPTTSGAFQTTLQSGMCGLSGTCSDAFLTVLNTSGSALAYSTFLGGASGDGALGVSVNASGQAALTGFTRSVDFPITTGAFQQTLGSLMGGGNNAFVAVINPAGAGATDLVYSSYLGGSTSDVGYGVAFESSGNVLVTGGVTSTNFPVTAGAFQSSSGEAGDAFVTKVNPAGTALNSLVYSSYLGGQAADVGYGIAVDAAGDIYVTGVTFSTNFPTTPDAIQPTLGPGSCFPSNTCSDAFVTRIHPGGSGAADVVFSSFLGGSGNDSGYAIATDPCGNIYATGSTISTDFPLAGSPIQSALHDANGDAFVTKISRPSQVTAAAQWSIVTSANTSSSQNNGLNDVTCVSANDCWAVGSYTNSNNQSQTLIEHYDGTAWSIVDSPNTSPLRPNVLNGVTCVSANNCWAVGDSLTQDALGDLFDQTLIEHYDGTTWSIVTSPNVSSNQVNILNDVTCTSATDCWAVGSFYVMVGIVVNSQTLVEHYDGMLWSIAVSPNNPPTGTGASLWNVLTSVTCPSANNCWAVGYYYNGTVYQTLVEQYAGTAWSIVTSPNSRSSQWNQLSHVTCASTTTCWAAGFVSTGQTLTEKYDGTAWSLVTPKADTSQPGVLYGVACANATDCWAVGNKSSQTLTEHYDGTACSGTAWTVASSPNNGSGQNVLNGVTCVSGTNCWAVGTYVNSSGALQTLIEHYGPQSFTLVSAASRKTHGSAGIFNVDLPFSSNLPLPPPGIECRVGGGSGGDHTLVFTFNNIPVSGSASVVSGTGNVSGSPTFTGHTMSVNVTGVTNAQVIGVTLNVTDNFGQTFVNPEGLPVNMGVLLGDVNASRRVDAADVSLVRQQTLQPVTSSNFREDINTSGRIDAADVSIARQQTLTSLP